MTIFTSTRARRKFFGAIDFIQIVFFIIIFALVTYLIVYFRSCISTHCDFTTFLSFTDPLLGVIIGIVTAMIFSLIQYFPNKITKYIENSERCAELKNQLESLKGDYIQLKNIETSYLFTIINQKNSRLVIINNLVDLLRSHYNEELSKDISFICEKGIRFPCSLQESVKQDLECECNIVIDIIKDVLVQLNKKPHHKHK